MTYLNLNMGVSLSFSKRCQNFRHTLDVGQTIYILQQLFFLLPKALGVALCAPAKFGTTYAEIIFFVGWVDVMPKSIVVVTREINWPPNFFVI